VRGVRGVVVEGVHGGLHAAMIVERFAGVGVHVEAREIAAAEIDADAVAFF
jgi:hypothetical protein